MPANISLILHALLTLPPTILFFRISLSPKTLPGPDLLPAILRNYALLLLSSGLSALAMYFQNPAVIHTTGTQWTHLALAVYHVAPISRALGRINGSQGKVAVVGGVGGTVGQKDVKIDGKELGGPMMHLAAHLVVVTMLVLEGLTLG